MSRQRHEQYALHIQGLPAAYTWKDLKDLVRQKAQHGIRGDVTNVLAGPGAYMKIGTAKVTSRNEAINLFSWYTSNLVENRAHTVHLFDATPLNAVLMASNCQISSCACCSSAAAQYRYPPVDVASNAAKLPKLVTERLSHASVLPVNIADGYVEMESRAIFIRGLDYSIAEDQIKALFSKAGQVEACVLYTDSKGKSKGAASVKYATSDEARLAVKTFEGWRWKDRTLQLRLDKDKTVLSLPKANGASSDEPVIVNGSGKDSKMSV